MYNRHCTFCGREIRPDEDRYNSPVCAPCADAIKDVLNDRK